MRSYHRKIALFLMLLLPSLAGFTQNRSVFLEIMGTGGFGSVNYEQSFLTRENLDLKWRVGLSFFPVDRNNGNSLIFPLLAEVLVGKGAHKFEGGLGQTFTITTKGKFFLLMPAVAGYRYQPPGKHFFFRASYTPIISYLLDFQYQNWGGLSFGYQFN